MIAKTKQFNLTKNQKLKNNYLKLIFPYFLSKRIKICKIILYIKKE